MKFLLLALFAVLAESASATKALSGDQLNAMLRAGKIDTKSLLKSAVPYRKEVLRKLQGDDEEQYGEGQHSSDYFTQYGSLGKNGITGDHSVSFNSCVSLTAEEEWENMDTIDNLQYFVQNQMVQSVRNYVLFNVCETTGDCNSQTSQVSEQNTYMVDLNTWVAAMIDYFPNQQESYCEGCTNQWEFCSNAQANGWDQNINYQTAAFFYDDTKFQLIDCVMCQSYGCYDENGDVYEQNGWEDVQEWIEELAQCQATEAQWMNMDLYAGFMCNQYGTGLEIGVFLDEDCSLYTSQKSYFNTIEDGDEDWANYGKSERIVNYLFNKQFECYGGDLIYVNLFQQVYINEDGWEYDPCTIDQNTGQYLDQEGCEEMMYDIPCYATYDENGDMQEADEDACASFMEANPCWSMPGQQLAEAYEESCYEYMASYSHEASSSCLALFGQSDGDGDGDGNDEDGQQNGQETMAPIALSSCAYQYQYGENANEDGDNNGGRALEDVYYDWSSLTYDISLNLTKNVYGICKLLDTMFVKGHHLDNQAYDPTISGQLYEYGDMQEEGDVVVNSYDADAADGSSSSSSSSSSGSDSSSSSNSVYYPTMPNMPTSVSKAAKASRKMGSGAIAATVLFTISAAFLILVVGGEMQRSKSRKLDGESLDTENSKDLPLMS